MSSLKVSIFLLLCFLVQFGYSQKHERLVYADQHPLVISVGPDGFFPDLTSALKSIPLKNTNRYIINLQPGVYREKLTVPVNMDFITIRGESQKIYDTKIVHRDNHASANGTAKSATLNVMGKYFRLEYITIENDAPFANPGATDGQAVALKLSGDFGRVSNCFLTSSQDTLLDDSGRHLFEKTTIQGNIDFIFGSGRSLYEKCTILSNSNSTVPGTITAHGKSATTKHTSGFSFHNCYVGGTGKTLLGRPWGSHAFVVFTDSYLDSVVEPAGWVHWNDVYNGSSSTAFYAEYNNFGPGANKPQRINWSRPITEYEATFYGSTHFIYGSEWL